MELLHKDLTSAVLSVFYDVYNELGYGFLEKVYQKSMAIELRSRGFFVESQKQILVNYKGFQVGEYFADLVINEKLILELKATEFLVVDFEYQLINYLKASDIEVGMLLNFGKKPEFRRKVFENKRKIFSSL